MSIEEIIKILGLLSKREDECAKDEDFSREARLEHNWRAKAIQTAMALLKTHPEAHKGAPGKGEALVGERRQSGVSETDPAGTGEGYGASADEEPLTQKQLQFMSAEPVWIVRKDGADRWALIRYCNSGGINTYGCGFLAWEDLGKTWFAYRRPPKEE